jgi:hypothetical protein
MPVIAFLDRRRDWQPEPAPGNKYEKRFTAWTTSLYPPPSWPEPRRAKTLLGPFDGFLEMV